MNIVGLRPLFGRMSTAVGKSSGNFRKSFNDFFLKFIVFYGKVLHIHFIRPRSYSVVQ